MACRRPALRTRRAPGTGLENSLGWRGTRGGGTARRWRRRDQCPRIRRCRYTRRSSSRCRRRRTVSQRRQGSTCSCRGCTGHRSDGTRGRPAGRPGTPLRHTCRYRGRCLRCTSRPPCWRRCRCTGQSCRAACRGSSRRGSTSVGRGTARPGTSRCRTGRGPRTLRRCCTRRRSSGCPRRHTGCRPAAAGHPRRRQRCSCRCRGNCRSGGTSRRRTGRSRRSCLLQCTSR
mmetsp:Transcript_30617/g.80153  ORF Transcript_30617/g.80153 Transcript_30617/m.80153 type:complete len:230 (+) Transcript_30617:3751-4440(+)